MQITLSGEAAREQLLELIKKRGSAPWILAIDGDAAAGKTTLAKALSEAFSAPIVHMDDFFLPAELRTGNRLNEPGGNVHYERFIAQVLPHLLAHAALSYRPFDCRMMDYGPAVQIPAAEHLIVEGAYSLHPNYGTYYDLSIFCTLDPAEQIRRIRNRNGEAMLQNFQNRWIPMEHRYQDAFSIPQKSQILYRT